MPTVAYQLDKVCPDGLDTILFHVSFPPLVTIPLIRRIPLIKRPYSGPKHCFWSAYSYNDNKGVFVRFVCNFKISGQKWGLLKRNY